MHVCKSIDIDVKYILQVVARKYSMFSLFSKRCWRLVLLWQIKRFLSYQCLTFKFLY